jgi:5-carboxymethyl-2-hydroxymuconate isomerase
MVAQVADQPGPLEWVEYVQIKLKQLKGREKERKRETSK